MHRNQTKICPGKKFVTNDYPGIYIYVNIQMNLDDQQAKAHPGTVRLSCSRCTPDSPPETPWLSDLNCLRYPADDNCWHVHIPLCGSTLA